jgi:alcohol dehydrogenase (cytochrome c)
MTGKLKWYFQHAPGESLDLDEVFERVLINHGDQKTVMTIGKPGILWKLDRVTGKFLAAKETDLPECLREDRSQDRRGDLSQGHLQPEDQSVVLLLPGPEGGHDWQATSYYQPDDLLIIPLSQSCVMIQGHEVEMKLGGGGTAASQKFFFMPGTQQKWASWRPIAPPT